jgi:ribosomal-protein-alanine N-acetyltransferase
MPLPLLTDRLLLRAMTLDDVPALHRIWSDAETMRFVSAGASRDLAHTRERVQWQIDAQDRNGYSLYAVVERATAAVVGDCGLLRMDDGGVEVGYRFDRAVWGRGLATEAVGAVVDQARDELALRELLGLVLPGNAASRHVLEKAGMALAGTRLHHGVENLLYVLRLER